MPEMRPWAVLTFRSLGDASFPTASSWPNRVAAAGRHTKKTYVKKSGWPTLTSRFWPTLLPVFRWFYKEDMRPKTRQVGTEQSGTGPDTLNLKAFSNDLHDYDTLFIASGR